MPASTDVRKQLTKVIRRQVNHYLQKLVGEIYGVGAQAGRFRRAMEVEEALEPASLLPFDINRSNTRHIDFGRLRVRPALLLEGLLNGDVLVRRFERVVDEQMVLAIDVTRSMRYPLRELYATSQSMYLGEVMQRPGRFFGRSLPPFDRRLTKPLDRQDLLWAKPSLAKLVAGALLQTATMNGFKVRVLRFGLQQIQASHLISDTFSLQTDLFEPFDRALQRAKPSKALETRAFERLLAHLDQYRGIFVIVSDFIAPSYLRSDDPRWRHWRRVCGLLRDFALRRRLVVVRVNQEEEVCERPPYGGDLTNYWHDRYDVDVEPIEDKPPDYYIRHREDSKDMKRCLDNQKRWARMFERALRPSCRGFLTVDNWHARGHLRNDLWRMWTRLLEH